jgi:predicted ATPase
MIGREEELGELSAFIRRLASGQGGVVGLVAEEGMGKSRLVAELMSTAGGRDASFLEARSTKTERQRSFHPFGNLCRMWAGIANEDSAEQQRAKLESAVSGVFPIASDEILASVATLMGIRLSARRRLGPRRRVAEETSTLMRSLTFLLRELAQAKPLVLVFEDLQWADPRSIELLEALIPRIENDPIVFMLVSRPGFPETSQRVLEFVSRHHSDRYLGIKLRPLDDRQSQRLIEAVVSEELSGATRTMIEERAGGNPARIIMGAFLAPALRSEWDRSRAGVERTSETERRRTTILFADISGFTAMSEKMALEEAHAVITGCLKLVADIARKHGGTVDKYLGDCVMTLFGVPEAIEDAPRAAINAAIEMRQRVRDYSREGGLVYPLELHIGINTGIGIAGDVSGPLTREFAVLGDPVSVASRLRDIAPPGRIFIGPETYRLTRDQYEYRPLDPIQLKGKKETVPTYELLSEEEHIYRARIGSERQIFSELVGRDEELARLKQCVARVGHGEGEIVSLSAEGGVGKSRLLAELHSAEGDEAINWLEGRSLSIGQTLSFHPFADLLRAWAKITDRDDDGSAWTKLDAAVSRLFPNESAEISPFVATVLGMRLPAEHQNRIQRIQGDAMEKLIRGRVTQLFRKMSDEKPLVLVFDDLHWADLSSIELLESLLRLAEDHPILFIQVFRTGFPQTSERLQDFIAEHHAQRHTEIHLDPLDRGASRLLINSLFKGGDIPHRTRAMIEEKAGGNPFYIEEVVRSLIDEGAIEYRDAGLWATEKIHAVVIPGTVQEVIMARVDRLDLQKKRTLQIASVVGRTFHYEVLAEIVADKDRKDRLNEDLLDLVEAQFLEPWDRLKGILYAFKHPLIQEVVYDSILLSKREQMHLEVARAIECRLTENVPGFYGMLAYHFSKGRDVERAEAHLFRAGDEAARVAASSEALHFFREASKLYFEMHGKGGDPRKKALIEKSIAFALFNRGQLIEAVEHFNRSLEFLGERVPRLQLELGLRFAANLISVLARLYLPHTSRKRAASTPLQREIIELIFERAEAQTTASPTRFIFDSMQGLAKLQRVDPATIPAAGGKYAGAIGIFSYGGVSFEIGRRFLSLASRLVDEQDSRGWFLYRLMNFLHQLLEGNWSSEHQIDEALIDENLRCGGLWEVTSYLGLVAEQSIHKGEFGVVRQRIDEIDKIWDLYQYDLAKTNHYYLPTLLLLEERRLVEAVAAAEAYYDENPEDLLHILALGSKAKAQTLLGELDSAEEALVKCAEIVARCRPVPPFHLSNYLRSRLLLDLARLEGAVVAHDRKRCREYRKKARKSLGPALRGASKVAWQRTEVFRLAGRYHWLSSRARTRKWGGACARESSPGPMPRRVWRGPQRSSGSWSWNGTCLNSAARLERRDHLSTCDMADSGHWIRWRQRCPSRL